MRLGKGFRIGTAWKQIRNNNGVVKRMFLPVRGQGWNHERRRADKGGMSHETQTPLGTSSSGLLPLKEEKERHSQLERGGGRVDLPIDSE